MGEKMGRERAAMNRRTPGRIATHQAHPGDTLMPRFAVAALLLFAASARADVFDFYLNPTLAKLLDGKNVKEVKQLTPSDIVDHDRVLPRIPSAFLIVRTNGGRYAKLLVQAGKQKIGEDAVPILSIERFVTYKEGEEQTV